jgi:hypothetical protein
LDITTARGRRDLAHRHVSIPRDDSLTIFEIESGLEALVAHLGPQAWMTWRWGAFSIPVGHRSTRSTNAGEAAQLGLDLAALAHCHGFAHLLGGFRNPTQFDDSIFEARMARWCLQRPAVRSLRFGAEYRVRAHVKRPDFEIATPIGRVVCECKRLHLGAGDLVARLNKIAAAFDTAMKTLQVPDDVRIEIEVQDRIAGDLDKAALEAVASAIATPPGHPVRGGPFLIARSEVGQPPAHEGNWEVQSARVRVGATPVGITPEYTYLLISSPWMERALSRAMGHLVSTALRQLPEQHRGAIFIAGSRRYGRTAATSRLADSAYQDCLTIATVDGNDIDFARRDIDRTTIEWLFLDRPPQWPARLRLVAWWRLGLRAGLLRGSRTAR